MERPQFLGMGGFPVLEYLSSSLHLPCPHCRAAGGHESDRSDSGHSGHGGEANQTRAVMAAILQVAGAGKELPPSYAKEVKGHPSYG